MANEYNIISDEALDTLCGAIKGIANAGEIVDDTGVAMDKTYSSFKIQEELDKKIDKDKVVTVLDDTVTDDEVASAKAVYDELQEVFQSVSNGKNLIASAITDKGVETLADATFEQMAENIGGISSGGYSQTNSALGGKGLAVSGDESDEVLSDVITDLFGLTTPLADTTATISRLDSTTVTTEDVAYDEELVRTSGWGLKFTTRKTSTGSVNEGGAMEFDEINLDSYVTELTIF